MLIIFAIYMKHVRSYINQFNTCDHEYYKCELCASSMWIMQQCFFQRNIFSVQKISLTTATIWMHGIYLIYVLRPWSECSYDRKWLTASLPYVKYYV